MIVYYSGTGNSRYCAEFLARHLEDERVDAFHFIRDGIAGEFIGGKPWVFVSPTYGWQLPRIFADFIKSGSFDGNDDTYFVMTCGSDIGNAGSYNEALCREKGLRYRGTLPVVMPENYVAMFPVPEEQDARRLVHISQRTLKKGLRCIAAEEDFPSPAVGLVGKIASPMWSSPMLSAWQRCPMPTTSSCRSMWAWTSSCPRRIMRSTTGRP